MAATHATLSPSSSERWSNCPGCIALSETVEKQPSSSYASEGTAAHSIAEELVTGKTTEEKLRKRVGTTITTWDGFVVKITSAMVDAAVAYTNFVNAEIAKLQKSKVAQVHAKAEVKVWAKSVDSAVYGTADFIIFQKGNKLIVIDFKYGQGVIVDPKGNKQMSTYAVGAMDTIAGEAYDEIELIIHQPRSSHKDGPFRRWTVPKGYFDQFRKEMKAAVAATRKPNAPLAAGKWCKFCPVGDAGVCPELDNEVQRQVQADFAITPVPAEGKFTGLANPQVMSPQKIAAALSWESGVASWFTALHKRARELRKMSIDVPGYKLVESRTHRAWSKGEDAIVEDLSLYLDKKELYEDPAFKSVPQVEKLLKKGVLEKLGLVTKPDGDLIVVSEDDPRPEVGPSAESEFGAVMDSSGLEDLLGLPTSTPATIACGDLDDLLSGMTPQSLIAPAAFATPAMATDDLLEDLMGAKVKRIWPE